MYDFGDSWSTLIICYSSKSAATYVVNFTEYEGLATKILKKCPRRPISVFVEMPEVEKMFSKASISNLYIYIVPLSYSAEEERKRSIFAFGR
jgi:hypothetical protein